RRFAELPEGKLTRLRASLVRAEALVELARELGLPALVCLGEGELSAAPEPRASILADALEALFGAVFLDGGYGAARDAVLRVFGERLAQLDPERPEIGRASCRERGWVAVVAGGWKKKGRGRVCDGVRRGST